MNIRQKYKRIFLWSSMWLFMSLSMSLAQVRSNPFEVKQRLSAIKETETAAPIPQTTVFTTTDSITSDSTIGGNKQLLADTKANEETNPFEVDHLPLRKNAVTNKTQNLKGQIEATQVSNAFLFWFLLLACALLAVVLNTKAKAIGLISKSILNENILKLFYREESTRVSLYLLLLYLIFTINLAILIYLTYARFSGPKGIIIFMSILGGVAVVYIVRHLFLTMLGIVFNVTKNTQLYSFAIMVFNIFLGICLLPINFLLAFGPSEFQGIMIGFSIGLVLIIVLLRTFRGVFIVSEHLSDRIFQIFIYLCAFEIAPMLVLMKFIMNLV